MRAWELFWAAGLVISGAAFAGITVVVAVRGFSDLRDMFAHLRERRNLGR
ncbi:MAG TPA: hypothetical protein VEG63_08525 [Candidatus Acidoferrales bacterium]|nr:hypothetical protein [Candidatus Acidoferrales bacterium]